MTDEKKPRLRLLKVVVQATFVLDDGESLAEQVAAPVTVSANEWASYSSETFPAQVAALEQQLADGLPTDGTPPTLSS
jgi:hypothetical protein